MPDRAPDSSPSRSSPSRSSPSRSSLRRHLLTDQAAEALGARIESGEWTIGAKIPGETTLAAELGVGRSTVREAIRILAGRGLVESRQGAGVFLRALRPTGAWDELLRRESIVDVVEARNVLEIDAARLAAARRTPEDVAALRAALRARSAATESGPEAFVDADIAVHVAIVRAAHNPVVTELFETFVPRIREAMLELMALLDVAEQDDPDADLHHALVEAVISGDAARAVEVSREHLDALLRELGGAAR